MDRIAVHLSMDEWNRVLAILATASWNVANPLIMELGRQLQAQSPGAERGLHNDGMANRAGPPNGADRNP